MNTTKFSFCPSNSCNLRLSRYLTKHICHAQLLLRSHCGAQEIRAVSDSKVLYYIYIYIYYSSRYNKHKIKLWDLSDFIFGVSVGFLSHDLSILSPVTPALFSTESLHLPGGPAKNAAGREGHDKGNTFYCLRLVSFNDTVIHSIWLVHRQTVPTNESHGSGVRCDGQRLWELG